MTADSPSILKAGVWRYARVAAACILIASALVFICYSMRSQLPLFTRAMRDIEWWKVAAAVLAAVPMYLVKAIYHIRLLERFSGVKMARSNAVTVYLQAQVVRYLPGKVWGLLYQSGRMASAIQPGVVVAANLWQMLITNVLALGVVGGLLLWGNHSPGWLSLTVGSIVLVEFSHRWPIVESFGLGLVARIFPKLGVTLPHGRLLPMRWTGTAMLCTEWIFFFLAFMILLNGKQAVADAVILGAWYGGASIVALAAFVVPAGIAVREAIFVAAPSVVDLDAAYLMLVAALARVVFFGAEIVAALAATFFGAFRRHE